MAEEIYCKDGVGKPLPGDDEIGEVPSWIHQPIKVENPCKGEEFCHYVKHIFKAMIMKGCPLEALSYLTGCHTNTFRKMRESVKGLVPDESWLNQDLRLRKGRKEHATAEWKMRGQKIIVDLIAWCRWNACYSPSLCYAKAKEFEPLIPLECATQPFMDVPVLVIGKGSAEEKRPKISASISSRRIKEARREDYGIIPLDAYMDDKVCM